MMDGQAGTVADRSGLSAEPPGAPPILEMRAISKSFPGVKALSDVTLSVRAGDIHAIVGENGPASRP